MKYWGALALKLAAIAGVLWPLWLVIRATWGGPMILRGEEFAPFARDLKFTSIAMLFWLLMVGLVYLAILDQRYRCRTCLRRLRMPLTHGAWKSVLLGPPRTDYICPFGHGTLRVAEFHGSTGEDPAWDPIDDMWKELEELEGSRK